MDWTEGIIAQHEIKELLERRLPIYSVTNFRELGGYQTMDGRKIKKGVFYRCGALGEANQEDMALIKKLGIHFILDLRSEPEALLLEDPIIPGALQKRLCGMHYPDGSECDFSPEGIERLQKKAQKAADEGYLGEYMHLLYKEMPFHNAAYQEMFKQLKKDNVPMLFHCTAGKDRTGVGAMLIMLALGVDEKTILKDYMLTNICREKEIKQVLEEYREEIKENPEFESLLVHAYGVDLKAAQMVLQVIHENYPDINDYFETEYHLNKDDLKSLRNRYLE